MTKTTIAPTAARKIRNGMAMSAPPRTMIGASRANAKKEASRVLASFSSQRLPEEPATHGQRNPVDGDRAPRGQRIRHTYPETSQPDSHDEEEHREGEGADDAAHHDANARVGS